MSMIGPTATTAHGLLAIAAPTSAPASSGRRAIAAQSRGDAQRAAEQFLRVADLQGAQCQWVGCGEQEHQPRRGACGAVPACAMVQHDGERDGGQQAGGGHGAKEGEVAAVPRRGQQREGRAHDQRSAVGGQVVQEGPDVAVAQCQQRRRGLALVVGEGPRLQPEDGEQEGAGEGQARGCGEVARAHSHAPVVGTRCRVLQTHVRSGARRPRIPAERAMLRL
ncbi:MAG: hypothetical protein ACXWZZ_09115 [Solirubrobacteraceae bacterium]